MTWTLKLQLAIFVFLFLSAVIMAIYKEKLTVKYAMNWLIAGIMMFVGVVLPNFMDNVASLLGFEATSNMVFVIGYIFLLYIVFNLAKTVSSQSKQIKLLIQEVSMMKQSGDNKCK